MMRKILFASAICSFLASGAIASAQGVNGELRCNVAGGFGRIVVSERAITCIYYRPDGAAEFYEGSSDRIGVDLGTTNARSVKFRVFVSSDPYAPAALDGDFAGPGFGVTLGAGIAADALIGGRGHAVSLVPIANSEITGIDVNAGLGALRLHYAGMEERRERLR